MQFREEITTFAGRLFYGLRDCFVARTSLPATIGLYGTFCEGMDFALYPDYEYHSLPSWAFDTFALVVLDVRSPVNGIVA